MEYSGRLTLLTILEKNLFRTPAISSSELTVSPPSINVIFALKRVLLEGNGLTILKNFLLSFFV